MSTGAKLITLDLNGKLPAVDADHLSHDPKPQRTAVVKLVRPMYGQINLFSNA